MLLYCFAGLLVYYIADNMNIIISGDKGVGKTTLCRRMADKLDYVGGVYSPRTKDGSLVVDISSNESRLLTQNKSSGGDWFPVGERFISKQGIKFAVESIHYAVVEPKIQVLFIDEIGRLEMEGGGFIVGVVNALSSGKINVLVVRKNILDDFLDEYDMYRFNVRVLSAANRDVMASDLLGLIKGGLRL